jgi:predicted nucleotidyltransferase
MSIPNKLNPIEAAQKIINNHFPCCQGALLAGSVVRGEATATSDLDIIIFDKNIRTSYRESLIDLGWAIEFFVHNLTSYKNFFESDKQRVIQLVDSILRPYGGRLFDGFSLGKCD